GRHRRLQGPQGRPRRSRRSRPRTEDRRPLPRRDLRRAGATRRHRPGPDRRAAPGAGRRAHGRARLDHRRGGPQAPAQALRRGRRRAPGHPRRPPRRLGRPGRVPARRADRGLVLAAHRARVPARRSRVMLSGLRLAFRIARREALRYKGRSALSIVLLGLPLLGTSLAATAYDTVALSDTEKAEQTLGEADAFVRLDWEGVPVVQRTWTDKWPWIEPAEQEAESAGREVSEAEVLAALPEGTSMAPYSVTGFAGSLQVETPDGVGSIETMGYDLSDPMYEAAGLEYLE